jgi:hypothetical protein
VWSCSRAFVSCAGPCCWSKCDHLQGHRTPHEIGHDSLPKHIIFHSEFARARGPPRSAARQARGLGIGRSPRTEPTARLPLAAVATTATLA